jgi:hypothetical protein
MAIINGQWRHHQHRWRINGYLNINNVRKSAWRNNRGSCVAYQAWRQ